MKTAALVSALCLAASVAAPASAGNVWIVDDEPPADFSVVNDALAAASDGDVILVREGAGIANIVVVPDKTLTIVGDDTPATGVPKVFSMHVMNLSAGKTVTIRGFEVDRSPFDLVSQSAMLLQDNDGVVSVEDCVFLTEFSASSTVRVQNCASVFLTRCQVTGVDGRFFLFSMVTPPESAVTAVDSDVYFHGCGLAGGAALFAVADNPFGPPLPALDGAAAVRVEGGRLVVSGGTIQGGKGGKGGDGASGCLDGGDGGPAVVLLNSAKLVRIDASLSGGPGGEAAGACPAGSPSPDIDAQSGTVKTILEPARSLELGALVREGESATVAMHGVPGELAKILFSIDTTSGIWAPGLQGGLLVGLPATLIVLGNLPPTGELQFLAPIPHVLPPGLDAVTLHAQSLAGAQNGLGILGAPSTMTILQAGL